MQIISIFTHKVTETHLGSNSFQPSPAPWFELKVPELIKDEHWCFEGKSVTKARDKNNVLEILSCSQTFTFVLERAIGLESKANAAFRAKNANNCE